MPIRADRKALYPANWREISNRIRFERAGGRCEGCGRHHGELVEGYRPGRITRVVLTTAHRNHDPRDNSEANLAAWCQRCHLAHDLVEHLAQRRRTLRRRAAAGDLFTGPYD